MKFARVVDGKVVELYELPAGYKMEEIWHPDILAQFIECPSDVEQHWTYDGAVFVAPPAFEPVIEKPTEVTN